MSFVLEISAGVDDVGHTIFRRLAGKFFATSVAALAAAQTEANRLRRNVYVRGEKSSSHVGWRSPK